MADTAAHLVDEVLPDVPVRQFVLSLPPTVRMLCAFRPDALSLTIGAFIRTVFAFQRRRARHAGLAAECGRCGAVTVVQRFGSACELNVHVHSIVLDGVYVDEADGRLGFRPLPAPTTAELHALTAKVARKVIRVLRRRGLLDETVLDDAAADEPALTDLLAESVAFPRARIVDPGRARPATDPAWLGSVAGFNLHAGVALSALDREGRERLCKYLLRPPLSDDRLSLRPDGRVALQLKTPWRDGTVAMLFTPEQFVARLAALVPRPGKNLVRYHGVLAPNARDRAEIVPSARAAGDDGASRQPPAAPAPPKARTGRYLLWHELLRRVFEIDVLACPKCGGRLRLLCTVHDGFSARRYLQGVSAQAPPAEARPPPGPVEATSA